MHCLCIKTSHGQKNPRICERVCLISGEAWLMRYWFIRNAFTRRMQTRWDMTRRFNCHKSDFYLLQVLWIKYFILFFSSWKKNLITDAKEKIHLSHRQKYFGILLELFFLFLMKILIFKSDIKDMFDNFISIIFRVKKLSLIILWEKKSLFHFFGIISLNFVPFRSSNLFGK